MNQNRQHSSHADSVSASAWRTTAPPALASSLLLWAAFAPLSLGWLGWIAPIGWLIVIERPEPLKRADYLVLWLSGCLFWLLTLQGIRLAFWPLTAGWIALSLYLAVYVPLFVLVSRILVFRWRLPIVWSAPIAWVGMELTRGYLVTGFSANLLAHTQANYAVVIQLADQFGGYGVSFLVMMIAVAIARHFQAWRGLSTSVTKWQTVVAWSALLLAIGYGGWRLAETNRLAAEQKPLLRVALIQENSPSFFDSNPQRLRQAWKNYVEATREAGSRYRDLDLVLWPESTFTPLEPLWQSEATRLPRELAAGNMTYSEFESIIAEQKLAFSEKSATVVAAASGAAAGIATASDGATGPSLLVGCNAVVFGDEHRRSFNSAVLIGPDTRIVDRYDKVHLVMFGEYIPLGPILSFIEDMFGFAGASAGATAKCFEVKGVRLVPCICFESVLPHFVSWQMRTIQRQGVPPDILVNITNDSWFRGSSILDHHLACAILTSVEHRRPMLVAANGGLSAWIDGAGRVREKSPRLTKHLILAEPYRDNRWGLFQWIGDAPAWLAAGVCLAAIVSSMSMRASSPNRTDFQRNGAM